MFTKMVITLSFGVRVEPTSTQTARGERPNPENTPLLRQEAWSTVKFGLKQDLLPLKSNNIIRRCLFDKFLNPLALLFEGNSTNYVG